VLLKVASAGAKDVDLAVAAARKAFKTTWGRNVVPGERAALLNKVCIILSRPPSAETIQARWGVSGPSPS